MPTRSAKRQDRNNPKKKKTSKKRKQKSKGSRSKRRNTKKTHTLKALSLYLAAPLLVIFLIYLYYLDGQIQHRFEGRIWQLPAHVYSRPLELYSGKSISTER